MRSHRFIALAAFLLVFTVPCVSLSEAYTDEEVKERFNEIFRESETRKSIPQKKPTTTPKKKPTTTPKKKPTATPKPTPAPVSPSPATAALTGWHPQAKYRVTRWDLSGNMTVEIEAKDGQKVQAAKGVKEGYNGRKISLRVPIEFTVPDGVEVIQMDLREGFNYKILDDGSLGELDTFEGQDERGNTHRGRQAYPGDRVLMVKSGAMTVWLLQ